MNAYDQSKFTQLYSNKNHEMKTNAIYTRKIGTNKGISRIWLEGKILSENGWDHQDAFNVEFSTALAYMVYTKSPEGSRKVAGKVGREIIDTNSKKITECFGDASHVTITHTPATDTSPYKIRITAA